MSAKTTVDQAEQTAPLRIVGLEVENFKRLKAVEIHPDPDGNLVLVTGRNGQGKSSLLDSIFAALAGARAIPDQPIRNGANKCRIEVTLGNGQDVELTVELCISQKAKQLVVRAADGSVCADPQTLLNALIGKLAFDPFAFMRLKPTEQREQLLKAVDLGIDLDQIALERKVAYDKRTEASREVKRLEGALQSTGFTAEAFKDVPAQEISSSDLAREFQDASEKHRLFETAKSALASKTEALDRTKADIVELERRLEAARSQKAELSETINSDTMSLNMAEMDLPDLAEMNTKLAGMEETNKLVRAKTNFDNLLAESQVANNQHLDLQLQIENLDEVKRLALEQASMPIEGLSFTDDGVTYRGLPLSQASSAEQLRVSIAIAAALNSRLRVLIIREGSLLDSESLAIIEEMARTHNFQPWIERVADAGQGTGIIIEDGSVVLADVEAA